jgi:NAD(P) transhydrogenase
MEVMDTKTFDLVVIGSGPGGEKGAAQAAYFGKKVALIEREDVLGGAAANTGTLPSKTLRESALYLSGYRQRGLYGINFGLKNEVTARDFLYRERLVVQSEHRRIIDNIKQHDVALYRGQAAFVDDHTISITSRNAEPAYIRGEVILIATGSSPHHPPIMPFHDSRVYDSDTILNIHDLPSSMLVAGGGVIGCEYACMFAALGIDVHLVEGRDQLLGFMDTEVTETLTRCMRTMDIDICMPDEIAEIDPGKRITVRFKSGKSVEVELVLAATGRNGNSQDLGLEKIGVMPGKRGNLDVDEHYQTSAKHIYAVGDVIGFPALASTSMEQARIAMVHAFDLDYKTELASILPYGIYTIPECSMAGKTEEALQKEGVPYVIGRARYNANARGQIIGDEEGFIKLLFHEDDMKLLGVHVIGELASELVHVGLTALLVGAGADLFIATCYNYPTLTEIYKYATYDALGTRAKRQAAK